ncbi:restriction endonuclease [Nocardia tengchongensis]|uniref:restriction endonuclease n=1 Tax=Nocardia tengchongensis TaxID=2055889 RepID=UPI0036809825
MRSSSAICVWGHLDADFVEQLVAQVLDQSPAYVRVNRLMHLNAPDSGRDIEAYCLVSDGLTETRHERAIVQVRHRPTRSVSGTDIAELVHAKLPLWEGEPIRRLIIATTGSFTQDAVRLIDDHNFAAKRPTIIAWSSHELQALIRKFLPTVADDLRTQHQRCCGGGGF